MIFHVYSASEKNNFLFLNKVDRDSNDAHEIRGHPPTYIAYSANGFVTKELWVDIMRVAAIHFKSHLQEAQGLLHVDQCAAHMSDAAVEILKNVNVDTLCFPSQL